MLSKLGIVDAEAILSSALATVKVIWGDNSRFTARLSFPHEND